MKERAKERKKDAKDSAKAEAKAKSPAKLRKVKSGSRGKKSSDNKEKK